MSSHPGMKPAVFLDRDGTIIEECNYLTKPEQVRLLPGVCAAIQALRSAGYLGVIATNQSAIGRGMMTEVDLAVVHDEMNRQLADQGACVDGLYHCPAAPAETPEDDHPERKPAPGMLLRAAREMGIDLRRSWMIGDKLADVLAGVAAGCRGTFLVRCGHDVADVINQLPPGALVVDDLAAAVELLLAADATT